MSDSAVDCLFCKIVAGEIPSRRIYEDDEFIAFLDIFPAGKGHTLVIPKAHHQDIETTPEDIYSDLARRVKRVSDILQAVLSPEGVTVFQMNKSPGWQSVFHIHFHLVPRWSQDGLTKPWNIEPATQAHLNELQDLLGMHHG